MDYIEITPALTPEEWEQRFFRRGEVMGFGFDGDGVSLMRKSLDGRVDSVRLEAGDESRAVAALALSSHPCGLGWQDHDDQIITAVLLSSYQKGISYAQLDEPLKNALRGVLARCGNRAARIAALLPPRP
jgi:hypothetical protein